MTVVTNIVSSVIYLRITIIDLSATALDNCYYPWLCLKWMYVFLLEQEKLRNAKPDLRSVKTVINGVMRVVVVANDCSRKKFKSWSIYHKIWWISQIEQARYFSTQDKQKRCALDIRHMLFFQMYQTIKLYIIEYHLIFIDLTTPNSQTLKTNNVSFTKWKHSHKTIMTMIKTGIFS